MMKVQAYLFFGIHSKPGETNIDYDIRSKMGAYAMLLRDYYFRIVGDNQVITVGEIEFKKIIRIFLDIPWNRQ